MRGISVHSHLYQPPREDPWFDEVMLDVSAAPSHDWNSRVDAECYTPNRAARLRDWEGKITGIVNNYSHMSFNIGPTLHSWIARHNPILNHSIKEADKNSDTPGAIAQGYNHVILPLCCDKDIQTQVFWGDKDFEHRFGRKPLGMWLPETAVDIRTLEALAANNIEFTILAPSQCAAIKPPNGQWQELHGAWGLDVTRPYRLNLPSGRAITIFFYYGNIAHDIAFGGLLDSGDAFAERLMSVAPNDAEDRILLIATDGETYGHHHKFGEMALAKAFMRIFAATDASLTTPNVFIKKHPAVWECRIVENSSWSCAHGVERWRSNCGCHTGGEDWWNQHWRKPLRDALDGLRDKIDEIYERQMKPYCDDPWALRDNAIFMYLDEEKDFLTRHKNFLKNYGASCSHTEQRRKIMTLLEAQKMRMFMYTSCGWFFNDISGIETKQLMLYATRAAELIKSVTGVELESGFIDSLEDAKSNRKELINGKEIARAALGVRKNITEISACAALKGSNEKFYSYDVKASSGSLPSGDINLRVADITVTDTRSEEQWKGSCAVLSTGGFDDVCRMNTEALTTDHTIRRTFYTKDLLAMGKLLEEKFPMGPWHLDILAQDDRNEVAGERNILAEKQNLDEAARILANNRRLLIQTHAIGTKAPPFLEAAAALAFKDKIASLAHITQNALDILEDGSPLELLLEEAHAMGLSPELSALAPALEEAFHEGIRRLRHAQDDANEAVRILNYWLRVKELKININPWRLQNEMWRLLTKSLYKPSEAAVKLAEELGFAVPEV